MLIYNILKPGCGDAGLQSLTETAFDVAKRNKREIIKD